MKTITRCIGSVLGMTVAALMWSTSAGASSHMDAPLITLDDSANTTDVYAFVTESDGTRYLSTALGVYPFEEPGIGPNAYQFDDNVRYEIHVALGDDVAAGRRTVTYRFDFETRFLAPDSILQSYLAPVSVNESATDPSDLYPGLNRVQTYRVTQIDHRSKKRRPTVLGSGVVPPNNQGRVTPLYNQGDDGENPAKPGVASAADLDVYTRAAIAELDRGHRAFAGQRDDGFYADIQAIFDLLAFRTGDDRFDSQGGFNIHTLALQIPLEELGGEMQNIGVYATTSRRRMSVLRTHSDRNEGSFVQVARQGNPLFCEGFVGIVDKDRYNRTQPTQDAKLFSDYARTPQLAAAVNGLLGVNPPVQETGREDLVGIFIPDVIKVDLSTGPARLAGGGSDDADNPDDSGFSRLSVFGGDELSSALTGGMVAGGWPNGRRFGDDVVDIAVSALLGGSADGIDNVNANDIAFNKVFPYAATPLNGRRHEHH